MKSILKSIHGNFSDIRIKLTGPHHLLGSSVLLARSTPFRVLDVSILVILVHAHKRIFDSQRIVHINKGLIDITGLFGYRVAHPLAKSAGLSLDLLKESLMLS